MGTITGKFHQNPLETVGGVGETRLYLQTDGQIDGRTDKAITIVPFHLRQGTMIKIYLLCEAWVHVLILLLSVLTVILMYLQ